MRTIALIPALNEENTIREVVLGVKDYVDEVVLIDDGSTDSTKKVAKEAGALVYSHLKNQGVGAAFATGIEKALELRAQIVVTLDADGQFQPADIAKIIDPIIKGEADVVTGSRFLDYSFRPTMSRSKDFGNRVFSNLVSRMTGQRFTDTQCGFRAYSREALLRLTVFGKFTYTQEVLLDLLHKNMRIVEVPVRVLERQTGYSRVVKNPLNYGLRAMKIIIQTERDHHPLRFFGVISLGFILPGSLMLLTVLINWLSTGLTSPVTSLITIGGILILLGVIFIILALVADMQGRLRRLQEEALYLLKRQRYS